MKVAGASSLCALLLVASCTTTSTTASATAPKAPITVSLWAGKIPSTSPEYTDATGRIWKVSNPSMIVYFPAQPSSQPCPAIIVCPGGAYSHLTRLLGADGTAELLGRRGLVVVALKYRLVPPSTDESDALADAGQAMRLVRGHAVEWNVDSNKVGILGWSAGGNLALNLATHCDPQTRPDFACLLCPWPAHHDIMRYPITHRTPPAFIASALDDKTAPTSFARSIADGYERSQVPHQLWVIPTGGHQAFSLDRAGAGAAWPDHFLPWLKQIGMLRE